MPFIVRREDGYQDRDRYTILTLFPPGKPWKPWKQQEQWNNKVLVTHGGNCGASYAPGTRRSTTTPARSRRSPASTTATSTALGQGFAVLSTALANTGHNCNVAMEAESLMMAKERLVEQYGEHPLHHRHRLLGRLDHPAHRRQRLPRHLPGPGHHLLLPRHADRRRAVRRLPPAAALLRGPVPLGAGRGLVADPDGRGRGPRSPTSTRSPPTRACSRRRSTPRTPAPAPEPVAGDDATRFDSETNPGGRALLGPRHDGQPARPRARVGVERAGAGGRARLRRHAVRQHRRAVRPRGAEHRRRSRPRSSSTST